MIVEIPAILTITVAAVAVRTGRDVYHSLKYKYKKYKKHSKAKKQAKRKRKLSSERGSTNHTSGVASCSPKQKKSKRLRVKKLIHRCWKKQTQSSSTEQLKDELMAVLYTELNLGTRNSILLNTGNGASGSELGGYTLNQRLPDFAPQVNKRGSALYNTGSRSFHGSSDDSTLCVREQPSYYRQSYYEEEMKCNLYLASMTQHNLPQGGLRDLRSCWANTPRRSPHYAISITSVLSRSSSYLSLVSVATTASSSEEMSVICTRIEFDENDDYSMYQMYNHCYGSNLSITDVESNISNSSRIEELTTESDSFKTAFDGVSNRAVSVTSSNCIYGGGAGSNDSNSELSTYLSEFVAMYNLKDYVMPSNSSIRSFESRCSSVYSMFEGTYQKWRSSNTNVQNTNRNTRQMKNERISTIKESEDNDIETYSPEYKEFIYVYQL